ncbi:MAG TPA: alpha/beta hydrolase [Sulfurovum sp.]|jgi:pimeloyl-ACP methyl ester carboxylesterase|nr:MAG: 2-hydroxy-6-oxohepta-2,4-dienoate hydrolase [Sulfurovum sp. 35-42-20]OYY55117.1 MAG: 2-hydroxy-6-oxohepta-2,4-dienoate hydrolase [Sulfurovum sp. 28-43-6]OYZ25646.1 MAG: 2-hydroxy-6-oxohepta-2,4-dienoate hydrolase [Sulfurovum sp. 16-42-52]OYZ49755.1 MAG: 2-hydroxy-6-oxohepta-2,4-dienoate hydrolase [Sulfurovum sp. 24-42-9]OZA45764.1 MAG: 2-hydroxy-6-oxohepta-2,4-dienoate hydrolase [Sulfurovum sp. 17-42-90]OZA61576.1 MAG: 2-hydroxy-6-oxohepta-2,4-dienoate hydrolase [Sulfurovum sp. 39-42-1
MALKEIHYKEQSFNLSYEILNPTQEAVLLVLHGWGSNKEIMKQAFGKTLAGYRHLYLDLPGFGYSSNEMVLSTQDYAAIVKLFLQTLGVAPTIAMGHSFGGKVSTLLAPPCLVLLSSSGILVEKPLSVRLKIALVKLLKPLGLAKLRALFVAPDAQGMSHAMYETFKNVVNEHFEDNFSASKSKALCFWGKEDTATPLFTGEKIASLIQDSHFYALEGDHFFFLQHTAFIEHTILEHCKGTH